MLKSKTIYLLLVFLALYITDLSGQVEVDTVSRVEGPIKAGTIRVRKKQMDSTAQFLVGYWGFCFNETISKDFHCRNSNTVYVFFDDGKYIETKKDNRKKLTEHGKWQYTAGKLTLTPTAGEIVEKSFSNKIIWLSSQEFYYKDYTIYGYFEKTAANDITREKKK